MNCPTCSTDNSADSNFCSSCGASLSGSPDETTLAYALPADVELAGDASGPPSDSNYAVLEVLTGPKRGSRFALSDQSTTAGRHPQSLIFLDDVTVSRRHAVIERVDGGYTVRDVGSLNGTYLNRELVDSATLSDGDELQVGKFKLVFVAAES